MIDMNTERFYVFITSKDSIIKIGIILTLGAIGLYLCISDIDFDLMPMVLVMIGYGMGSCCASICYGFYKMLHGD